MNMNDHGSAHHHEDDNHETENGQRRLNAMAAMTVFATCSWRRNRRRDPVPMHNSSLTGRMRVNEILNGHPQIIQGIISATIQQTSYLFQHSKETTSRWFYTVLLAICSLKDEFIRPPDYTAVQPLIQEHMYKYRPWFDVGDPLHEEYVVDCMPLSGNVDVNADYVFEDVASGTGPSTGLQQHDTRMDAMNRVRDMMADDMWDRFQSASWYKTT
ncbi:hypothetical protein TIFTF001_035297 [Ficus carica]|uniref:Uncharacterized protein n=1 Tax=Ficus carica TaxID=3494 RepID=A0AA88J9V8_FICCA|nr:hypothetical protein TIFTF001_035297 [Ficus carica]